MEAEEQEEPFLHPTSLLSFLRRELRNQATVLLVEVIDSRPENLRRQLARHEKEKLTFFSFSSFNFFWWRRLTKKKYLLFRNSGLFSRFSPPPLFSSLFIHNLLLLSHFLSKFSFPFLLQSLQSMTSKNILSLSIYVSNCLLIYLPTSLSILFPHHLLPSSLNKNSSLLTLSPSPPERGSNGFKPCSSTQRHLRHSRRIQVSLELSRRHKRLQ